MIEEKTAIPEQVAQFLMFSELSGEAKARACRKNAFLQEKYEFKISTIEDIEKQLFKTNGDLACMTIEERERWYGN